MFFVFFVQIKNLFFFQVRYFALANISIRYLHSFSTFTIIPHSQPQFLYWHPHTQKKKKSLKTKPKPRSPLNLPHQPLYLFIFCSPNAFELFYTLLFLLLLWKHFSPFFEFSDCTISTFFFFCLNFYYWNKNQKIVKYIHNLAFSPNSLRILHQNKKEKKNRKEHKPNKTKSLDCVLNSIHIYTLCYQKPPKIVYISLWLFYLYIFFSLNFL